MKVKVTGYNIKQHFPVFLVHPFQDTLASCLAGQFLASLTLAVLQYFYGGCKVRSLVFHIFPTVTKYYISYISYILSPLLCVIKDQSHHILLVVQHC